MKSIGISDIGILANFLTPKRLTFVTAKINTKILNLKQNGCEMRIQHHKNIRNRLCLYVITMPRTRFRVNLHPKVA